MTTRALTAKATVLQSALIHPDWTATDHAEYLLAEYVGPSDYFLAQVSRQGLIARCAAWLMDPYTVEDRPAFGMAGDWRSR